ncbi:MAG TPA: succinate dehydrogenase cytochrome b subunit [Microthrixaceae bacterium]|nr:succinate dehydrogenase cytochrome b subunit [Microthrixaceae bacterium]
MAQATELRRGAEAPRVNKGVSRRAPWPVQFYESAVGKKWVMGLTGLALYGFVFGHMIGNLKIYLGREPDGEWAIDAYGHFLRELLHPLLPNHVFVWLLRIGLIVAFVLHIHAASTLTLMNRRSRPVGYQSSRDYIAANFASRTMRWTGVIILAFLIFHLFDLSWTGTGQDYELGHVHDNMIASLSRPWVAAVYILGNAALLVHLFHGIWSSFQTLGLNNPRWNGARRLVSLGAALLVGIPNILFPLLIVTDVVT